MLEIPLDVLLRDDVPASDILPSLLHHLADVETILDLLEGAVIRKVVEDLASYLFWTGHAPHSTTAAKSRAAVPAPFRFSYKASNAGDKLQAPNE